MTPACFLADPASSALWIGWEAMAPSTRMVVVIACFLLGLWLAYLHQEQCARRHLQLLTEQDKLKRKWDALNECVRNNASTDPGALPATASTDFGSSGAEAAALASVEPMPVIVHAEGPRDTGVDRPAQPPATPAAPIVEEPVSLMGDDPGLSIISPQTTPASSPVQEANEQDDVSKSPTLIKPLAPSAADAAAPTPTSASTAATANQTTDTQPVASPKQEGAATATAIGAARPND